MDFRGRGLETRCRVYHRGPALEENFQLAAIIDSSIHGFIDAGGWLAGWLAEEKDEVYVRFWDGLNG